MLAEHINSAYRNGRCCQAPWSCKRCIQQPLKCILELNLFYTHTHSDTCTHIHIHTCTHSVLWELPDHWCFIVLVPVQKYCLRNSQWAWWLKWYTQQALHMMMSSMGLPWEGENPQLMPSGVWKWWDQLHALVWPAVCMCCTLFLITYQHVTYNWGCW